MLERLALRDGTVDAKEASVLGAIFARADLDGMDPHVLAEIEDFKTRYGIR